jgi:Protein of unknown function (DUF3179)
MKNLMNRLFVSPEALLTGYGLGLLALVGVSLLSGAYGTFALTEIGQMLDMPRNWIVVAYQSRVPLTANLVLVFVLALLLNIRKPLFTTTFLGIYVCLALACIFFINFFAPEIWLRSQQHGAEFMSIEQADKRLDEDADIFVLEINGDARAYPRDWMQLPHIVGDEVGGQEAVMTYCALSNLPMAFDPRIDNRSTDLKVIAQVHNNLIFADDISGEMVQQITGTTEFGQELMTGYPAQRMPWKSFKALYPGGKVFDYQPNTLDKLSLEIFDISLEPHYKGQPMFPTLDLDDSRLNTGEAVWGLNIEGEQLAITRSGFDRQSQWLVKVAGSTILLVWYPEYETVGSYYVSGVTEADLPLQVDVYGNFQGEKLQRTILYSRTFWMIWSHWFPDTVLID